MGFRFVGPSPRAHVVGRALFLAIALAGCSAVPNMDAIGSGCANRAGAGPRDTADPPGIPLDGIAGLTPAQAAAAAAAMGHVVVFRLNHTACVCIPPLGYGPITEGWWGSNGQLYLDLDGVTPQGQSLPDDTGC
jgi:hypothetical protein